MLVMNDHLITFWLLPWSKPFRAACHWFALGTQPMQGRAHPDKEAPRCLRPLFLQRLVGQAAAARLAWLQAHPLATRYRYGRESEPRWFNAAWASYERCILREFADAMLLWIFGMEVEQLVRIAEEHPSLVGQVEWVCATLGAREYHVKDTDYQKTISMVQGVCERWLSQMKATN